MTTSPNGRESNGDATLPLDFWIVSSWRCPQNGVPCCTADQLDYYHVTEERDAECSDLPTFRDSIRPDVPVCIVIHGSYTTWRGFHTEIRAVYRWIRGADPGRPLQMVFFAWPSEPPTTILPGYDVAVLGMRASFNGFYVAQLVQQLPDKTRVSFFAHSHGARILASALHLLDGGGIRGYCLRNTGGDNRQYRPVFSAAAIDHHWLNPGERFGGALNRVDRGLVLFNRRDLALTLYPLRRLFSHRPLGLVGFDWRDRCLQNGRANKLAEVDVTPLIDRGHFWTRYFRQPQIVEAMRPYLFFSDAEPTAGQAMTNAGSESNSNSNRKPHPRPIRHSSSTIECTLLERRS